MLHTFLYHYFALKRPNLRFQLVCDGPTDGRTDGRNDGRTHPLIEMRECQDVDRTSEGDDEGATEERRSDALDHDHDPRRIMPEGLLRLGCA